MAVPCAHIVHSACFATPLSAVESKVFDCSIHPCSASQRNKVKERATEMGGMVERVPPGIGSQHKQGGLPAVAENEQGNIRSAACQTAVAAWHVCHCTVSCGCHALTGSLSRYHQNLK